MKSNVSFMASAFYRSRFGEGKSEPTRYSTAPSPGGQEFPLLDVTRSAEEGPELLSVQAAVAENLAHQPRTDRFTGMYRNYGRSSVRMSQDVVGTANSHCSEPAPL